VKNSTDTRQAEYTELTAACGELVYVRLEQDPIKAAEMIVAFTSVNCAESAARTNRNDCQRAAFSGRT
jgi:hypothetical protein